MKLRAATVMSVLFASLALLVPVESNAGEAELAVYPGVVHTRIGRDVNIGGEFFRLAYFQTPDSMEKVARYFLEKWKEEGYPVFLDGSLEKGDVVVSAFYTREGLMRSVVLRRHLDKTLGFTVLKDLWMRAESKPGPGLLKLEGTYYSSDVSFEDGPGGAQQRSHLVERSFDAVVQELRARLGQSGYQPMKEFAQSQGGKRQLVLEFSRRGEQLVNVVTEVDGALTTVTQLVVGSDRPDLVPNDDAVRRSRKEAEAPKKKGGAP